MKTDLGKWVWTAAWITGTTFLAGPGGWDMSKPCNWEDFFIPDNMVRPPGGWQPGQKNDFLRSLASYKFHFLKTLKPPSCIHIIHLFLLLLAIFPSPNKCVDRKCWPSRKFHFSRVCSPHHPIPNKVLLMACARISPELPLTHLPPGVLSSWQ